MNELESAPDPADTTTQRRPRLPIKHAPSRVGRALQGLAAALGDDDLRIPNLEEIAT
jgi:hypothetical protein